MFTGIIQSIGQRLGQFIYPNGSIRLYIAVEPSFLNDVSLGDSIALQGACMTVCEKFTTHEEIEKLATILPTLTHPQKDLISSNVNNIGNISTINKAFCSFDVSNESLSKIVDFQILHEYNLEKALRLSDFIGGHLVSGHVDGRAQLRDQKTTPQGAWLQVAIPQEFSQFMMQKGSVTLNGVSLTINQLDDDLSTVELYLIPHTLEKTTLKHLKVGDFINLEIDLMARYIERLLQKRS